MCCRYYGSDQAVHNYLLHALGPAGNLSFPYHVARNWDSPVHTAGQCVAWAAVAWLGLLLPLTLSSIIPRHSPADTAAAGAAASELKVPHQLTCVCLPSLLVGYGWPIVIDKEGVYRRVEGDTPAIVHQYDRAYEATKVGLVGG